MIFMFDLRKDDDLLDLSNYKRKKVYHLRDEEGEVCQLSESEDSDGAAQGGLMLQKLNERTAQD